MVDKKDDANLKIADFGFAKKHDAASEVLKTQCGTPGCETNAQVQNDKLTTRDFVVTGMLPPKIVCLFSRDVRATSLLLLIVENDKNNQQDFDGAVRNPSAENCGLMCWLLLVFLLLCYVFLVPEAIPYTSYLVLTVTGYDKLRSMIPTSNLTSVLAQWRDKVCIC